jgi:DNA/RNA endonuclease G (NUC1)
MGLHLKLKIAYILLVLSVPSAVLGCATTGDVAAGSVIGGLPLEQNLNLTPCAPLNVNHVPEIFISRNTYVISYNTERRLMNWASWKLELSDIGHVGRSNNFLPDPDLQTYLTGAGKTAVTKDEYTGSCFDRGHQVPSADRDVNLDINQLTFFMSNMIPQTAYLNRVVWEHLESYTRDLVVLQNKKVYVIAGPIFDEDFGAIGPNKDIPVPSKDFKILVILDHDQNLGDPNVTPQIIAVVMPNLLATGEKPNENRDELCKETQNPVPGGVVTPKPEPTPNPTPAVGFWSEKLVKKSKRLAKLKRGGKLTEQVDPPGTYANDDWKKYQTDLSTIEKLSGFQFTFSQP